MDDLRDARDRNQPGTGPFISRGYERDLMNSPVPDRFESIAAHPATGSVLDLGSRERELVKIIKHVARTVKKVVDSSERLFGIRQGDVCSVPTAALEPLARRRVPLLSGRLFTAPGLADELLTVIDIFDGVELRTHFPGYVFNPYVALLERGLDARDCCKRHRLYSYGSCTQVATLVEALNGLVDAMRSEARSVAWRTRMDNLRRGCDKNRRELRNYINRLLLLHTRHLVLRLTLYCSAHSVEAAQPTSGDYETTKKYIRNFERHLHKRWPLSGYAIKRALGLRTGDHFHCVIFLDGEQVTEHVLIACSLGEYWVNVITAGQGRYDSCNGRAAYRALGLVESDDRVLCEVLITEVCQYLTRTDFWLKLADSGRTFMKGNKPKSASVTPPR